MIHDVCCINGFELSIDPSMQKSLPDCYTFLRDYIHSPQSCVLTSPHFETFHQE